MQIAPEERHLTLSSSKINFENPADHIFFNFVRNLKRFPILDKSVRYIELVLYNRIHV